MNRDQYLNFISSLSKKYHTKFGNVWWYSLLHEKNTTKDNFWFKINSGLDFKKEKFIIVKCILLALKKYISFIYRYFYFNNFKLSTPNKKYFLKNLENIAVTYKQNHLDFLSQKYTRIYIPQKKDFFTFDDSEIVLDNYISFVDFIIVLYSFSLKFWRSLYIVAFILRKEFNQNLWHILNKNIYRSFIGDVFVECLFFNQMFKRLKKQNEIQSIVYPYEGLGWEKLLCNVFNRENVIGTLCSFPSDNILNFWYNKEETNIMPTPKTLVVFNEYYRRKFKNYDCVKVYGLGRYEYLRNIKKNKKRFGCCVILSSNNYINKKLEKEVENCIIYNSWKRISILEYKNHPDIKSDNINPFKWEYIIVADSSLAIELFLSGSYIDTILIDNVNLCPLPEEFNNCIDDNRVEKFRKEFIPSDIDFYF